MKHLYLSILACCCLCLSATAQRVYINPGHGEWGSEGRNMATITHAIGDTTGFWESNTNLWKAFALNEKLQAAGLQTLMSRTENGPYPYVKGDESIDKPVLDLGEEAEWWGATHYISIHSNAGPTGEDGSFANYPLYIYKGYDSEPSNWASEDMAYSSIMRLYEIFDAGGGPEPTTYYSPENPNVRGSSSFYGYTLGALNHSVHGYLAEGYFHTYSPARHRALNPDWCRQEGVRYFRGIMNYYDGYSGESVGHILGYVRSRTEMYSHAYYIPMPGTNDQHLPINGAKVVLCDASGNIIRTECYRHVACHKTDQYYYTTDDNYNGIFVFEDLKPGTYSISVHAKGYHDKKMEVTVTANKTVYPEIFLEIGQGTDPNINVEVQWVLNGGTVDGTLPSTITEEYRLPIPYKAGYAFQGWFDNEEGTGTALATLEPGYKGTLYAIWRAANVKWELNGGHISENKLLWEDFQRTKLGRSTLVPIENASTVINEVGGEAIYNHLSNAEGGYKWLGDYLWNKAYPHVNPGSGNEYIWWGNMLNAFLNSTTYNFYCHHCSANVTVDFTELGKYDSWKGWATEEIRQKVTLPNQITSAYTIPTPEKEGATFQGWYDNPHGMGNPITVLRAGYEGTVYAIWVGPVPCIVAYNLNCTYKPGAMAFDFSFYANTQPASGKLIFYNEKGQPTQEIELSNLRQGKNTVFIQVKDIPEFEVGQDIFWEVHLEARPSTLFAEIFRSSTFNTAYATIDNNPASDFFGSIWVANQKAHGYNNTTDGEIWRLVPELAYARDGEKDAQQGHRPHRPRPGDKPNPDGWKPPQGGGGQPPQGGGGQPPQGGGGQRPQGGKQEPPRGGRPDHTPSENTENGFEVIFRPTVAPDGTVYLTDNGPSYGGVFIMDPHTKQITNFFDGCTYENGEWKDNNGTVVGSGSTGAHIYCTENEAKLYLIHNTHPNAANDAGQALGFFKYDLMKNGELQHTYNNTMAYKAFANGYRGTLTDYAIVGTSHGIWVCNLRIDNVYQDPSLSFYSNDGMVTYFEDPAFISGSWGAALAVNHDETILVMVDRDGDLLQFDINWSEDVPSLTNKQVHQIFDFTSNDSYDRPTITTLNFDYAGNLVATLGETYNDASDKHQVVIFTLPKTPNHIDVPSRYSQRVPSLVEDDQCNSIAEVNTTYETVEVSRKMQAGMFNTICLPFAIDDLNTLPEDHPYYNATVVEFVGTERIQSGKEEMLQLNFSQVTSMQAGMPYLIQPTKDITNPYYFSNVQTGDNVAGKSVTPANSEATFQGITSPTKLEASLPIVFLVDQNRLAISTTSGQMLGNRAYFTLLDSQNIPKRSVISIVKAPTNNHNLYINTTPTSYKIMEDGHIWIIRGGEKYNLMGAKVK